MPTRRTQPAVLVALLAAALLAGCDRPTPTEVILTAGYRTAAAGSARLVLVDLITTPGSPGPVRLTGEGVVDFRRRASTMSLAGADPRRSLPDRLILAGDAEYQGWRAGVPAGRLPPGKRWMRLALDSRAGGPMSGPAPLTTTPLRALQLLGGITAGAEAVGTEQVRGVSTTHYRGSLNVAAAVRIAGARRADLKRMADRLLVRTLPADVWIDREGLVRRMRYGLATRPPHGSKPTLLKVNLELYDFGTPVDAIPPPAGVVVEAT
ncbi:MAG TPA: hypothetical protein VKG45_04065 [Actinomycetes bacterium]|nr:hypothetical protein [Actinomycetes bacterium]